MIPRYGVAAGISVWVTFGLLFVMQLLIANGRGAPVDDREFRVLDFVRVIRDPVVETKKPKPVKPREPELPPDLPDSRGGEDFGGNLGVTVGTPSVASDVRLSGTGFGVSDGEYLPIVKVEPIYPARAQLREVEGHVIVEYTVTRTGATRDVRVVESSSGLLDRSCAEAAAKFKYRPRVIDGEPVEVPGVRNLCTYRLDR